MCLLVSVCDSNLSPPWSGGIVCGGHQVSDLVLNVTVFSVTIPAFGDCCFEAALTERLPSAHYKLVSEQWEFPKCRIKESTPRPKLSEDAVGEREY